MNQGKLGLSIRVHEAVKPLLVPKMTPRHVSKWLKNLPAANISATSKQLYQMLVDCNKTALSDDDRFKIMIHFHQVAQIVLRSLSKHFTGHTLNLSDKQKKIAALVQAIHTEMAIGFKNIIENQNINPKLLQKKQLQLSIFFGLEYLSLIVVRCYQIYTSLPQRLWKEINVLYQFALEQKFNAKLIETEGFSQEHSIDDIFRKICLMSTANPYQLRQTEIELVFNGLQRYAQYCELDPSSRFDNRYIIDLSQAHPPIHQAFIKTRPSRFTYSLNVDKVVDELEKTLKANQIKHQDSIAVGGLTVRLIRHLLKNWAHLASRNFARTPCKGLIRVSVGLHTTHELLAGPLNEESQSNTLENLEGSLRNATIVSDDDSAKVLSHFGNQSFLVDKAQDEDVWEKLYKPKNALPADQQKDYSSTFKKSNNNALKPSIGQYALTSAEIMNISPGGYCLHLTDKYPQQTLAGEVIGLVETENGQESWNIGVIRWIKRAKNNEGLQVGVQLIAPAAKPIHSQLRSEQTQVSSYQSALLLPELKGIGQPATIITNPVHYNSKQKIRIRDGDEIFEARLTKLVSSSQGYRQFFFEMLADRAENGQQSIKKESDVSSDGFDNVWDLI